MSGEGGRPTTNPTSDPLPQIRRQTPETALIFSVARPPHSTTSRTTPFPLHNLDLVLLLHHWAPASANERE
ncbi:hypothetical protein TIFTF001_017235 [Ficus carica]|uniref:Uncharacterized protein n=1 Tax=Ficus carica TaxID=3494 RepID=A0AA88D821_FICCA|nr:hypothetical protein TIFTF001_017235 [Ficus carica]